MTQATNRDRQRALWATHGADHAILHRGQRAKVQLFRENLDKLIRRRDVLLALIDTVPRTPDGNRVPDREQSDDLVDATANFFNHAYTTLTSLAGVYAAIRIWANAPAPSTATNTKFLTWLSTVGPYKQHPEDIDVLWAARHFRTIDAHSNMWPELEWGTRHDGRTLIVVRTGRENSQRKMPAGATRPGSDSLRWEFPAPNPSDVIEAFIAVAKITFGAMDYELSDGSGGICTVEADGHGSTIGIVAAQRLRELIIRDFHAPEMRFLAPTVVAELDALIASYQTWLASADARRRDEAAAARAAEEESIRARAMIDSA